MPARTASGMGRAGPGGWAAKSPGRQIAGTSVRGNLVDRKPAPVEVEMEDRWTLLRERVAQGRFERFIVLDGRAVRTERTRNAGEVHWPQVRPDRGASPLLLVGADRAVPAVVENDRDRARPLAHGRFPLRHRPRETAAAR